jgi:innexin
MYYKKIIIKVNYKKFFLVIKCWVPAFFTQNYETYANQVCWISNTYYVNQTATMPEGPLAEETKKSTEIKYYQWVPFILLIQALFLYIPRIMW